MHLSVFPTNGACRYVQYRKVSNKWMYSSTWTASWLIILLYLGKPAQYINGCYLHVGLQKHVSIAPLCKTLIIILSTPLYCGMYMTDIKWCKQIKQLLIFFKDCLMSKCEIMHFLFCVLTVDTDSDDDTQQNDTKNPQTTSQVLKPPMSCWGITNQM